MRDLYGYSLSPDHLAASVRRHSRRVLERMHTSGFVQLLGGIAVACLAALVGEALTDGQVLAPLGVPARAPAAIAIVCIALAVLSRHHGILLLVRRSTLMPGAWKLGVDDDGLWLQGPHGESFTRWTGWRTVEEKDGLVLLYHDELHHHPVPFSAFASEEERSAFVDHVRARIATHPVARTPGGAVRMAGGDAPQAPPPKFAPTFATLLRTAARIALLQPVAQSQLNVTWIQVVGVVLATLVPPVAFTIARVGEHGHIAWESLPAVLFHVPVILVAAVMVAHFIGRAQSVVPILAGALLAWAAIDFLSLGAWLALLAAVGDDPIGRIAFHYVPIAWLALAVARLGLSFIPAPGPRLGWVVLTCAMFLALPLAAVQRERSLWMPDPAPGGLSLEPVAANRATVPTGPSSP